MADAAAKPGIYRNQSDSRKYNVDYFGDFALLAVTPSLREKRGDRPADRVWGSTI